MKTEPLIKEVVINAPASNVWQAITTKEGMKTWGFDIAEFRPETGFEFTFKGGKPGGTVYIHKCTVMEAFPNKKLSYSWRYEGYTGDSVVTFELFEEGDKTRLKLTHEGIETFPKEVTDLAKENFEAGWTAIVGRSIKEYAESIKS